MINSPFPAILTGCLLAAGCMFGSFYNIYRKRIIDDLPTSKTRGVFIGPAELTGTAESEEPLTSYLAEIKCVYYEWQIDEHWERTVTETYHDAQGHTQTRTRVESGWQCVAGECESPPFYLKDETGIIRIVPEGFHIEATTSFNETVNRLNPLYYGKGPQMSIANSTHRRRFQEKTIPLHTMLYVLGHARERQDVVAAEIAKSKDSGMFIISVRSEKQISSGYGFYGWLCAILGLAVAIGAGAWWAVSVQVGPSLSWYPFVIMTGGYAGVFFLTWVWTTYNSLVNLHHRVEQGWSQIDVQLKRRYDLIPRLVQSVEGYKQYEAGTQAALTELRTQMEATPSGMAGPDYKGLVPILGLIVESYPNLKANETFSKLQQMLIDTEQRIALARDYYNDIATFYNTRLSIIPDRYAAALARLHPRALMGAWEFERAPVKVNLSE